MKSKNVLLLAIFIACISFEVRAQSITYPKFHLGIRGGYTLNSISGDGGEIFESLNSPYGGLSIDFRIAQIPLYLETGAYYFNRRHRYKINPQLIGYSYSNKSVPNYYGGNSVNVPLLLSYHYYLTDKLALQPFAGGFAGYLTDLKKLDYGVRFGIGINYGRIYANAAYEFGLDNLCSNEYKYGKGPEYTMHMNVLLLTLGFNLIGSR